jgi:hypothetical protein
MVLLQNQHATSTWRKDWQQHRNMVKMVQTKTTATKRQRTRRRRCGKVHLFLTIKMSFFFIAIFAVESDAFLYSPATKTTPSIHFPQQHHPLISATAATTSSRSKPSSLIVLHDIPALFNNLLTQSPNDFMMVEHSQRILLDNGMQITIDKLSSSNYNNIYAQAATTLFVNMLTPASILAAAMISLGLKAPFQIPNSIKNDSTKNQIQHVESLRRAYIVVTLISFCSELLAVMWGTVAVNQLNERTLATSCCWKHKPARR